MKIEYYINPWYNSRTTESKAVYKATEHSKQQEYKGYYLIQGVNPWVDVVENVVLESDQCADGAFYCVKQVGSVRYAKQWIDNLFEKGVDIQSSGA